MTDEAPLSSLTDYNRTVYPHEERPPPPHTRARVVVVREPAHERARMSSTTRSDDAYDASRDARVMDIVDDAWAWDALPDDGAWSARVL